MKKLTIDEITNFCKRKGFVFRSSDIYGGFAGFWDYGPLGVELLNNIKKEWWNHFVRSKENMTGIDASIISHPRTWKASGHLEGFKDVFVKCKKCKKNSKVEPAELETAKCESCGGDYESLGEFDMLFKTEVGSLDKQTAYLRGETAQAMFMNFKQVAENSRMSLPFGIAQIGKCFRNEIAPRNFLFRLREFNIAELEFFIHPDETTCLQLTKEHKKVSLRLLDAETQVAGKKELTETTIGDMVKEKRLGEWHGYWLAEQIMWYTNLRMTKIKIREHTENERSFYSSATFDVDYEYPFGSEELGGNANRGQYDLKQHIKESKKNLEIHDEKSGKKMIPRVIEPTFGMERTFLAAITEAYTENEKGNIILKLHPRLAPVKAAVLPLVKKNEKLVSLAREIYDSLKTEWNVTYDESGSVGRRYARNDEIGTPFCLTIDSESLEKGDVTIRNRDDGEQKRISTTTIKEVLRKLISGEMSFTEL